MQILTFAAIKGGVGKTTLTLNYGSWLARQGYKVLLIDLDHQCNLTTIYEETRRNNTIAEAFKDEDDSEQVTIDHVAHNTDLIAGFIDLDVLGSRLENDSNKEMKLYMWFKQNMEKLALSQYDYILIDTHPDFSTITKNAVAVSDFILSPITPSEHGYTAKFDLAARLSKFRKSLFDYNTGISYIDARVYYIANMVKHNTTTSHELLDHVKDESDVIAVVPDRELFNKATTQHKSIYDLVESEPAQAKTISAVKEVTSAFSNIHNAMEKETAK